MIYLFIVWVVVDGIYSQTWSFFFIFFEWMAHRTPFSHECFLSLKCKTCLFALKYIGIHGEMQSTKGLLKRWWVKDMRWEMKDIRWRSRWELHFPMYWITRVMAGNSFPVLFLFYFPRRKSYLMLSVVLRF